MVRVRNLAAPPNQEMSRPFHTGSSGIAKTMCGTCLVAHADGVRRSPPNQSAPRNVPPVMNPLPCLTTCFFASLVSLGAHTCREVVRDSSGRVVQTIERRTDVGGTVHTVIRDASGRLAGTSITRPDGGGGSRTDYRDANGRHSGSATTRSNGSGSSNTSYRDAQGRSSGSAVTQKTGTQSRTQLRDASGRSAGTVTTNSSAFGTTTSVRRDASSRLSGSSTGSGSCRGNVATPPLHTSGQPR